MRRIAASRSRAIVVAWATVIVAASEPTTAQSELRPGLVVIEGANTRASIVDVLPHTIKGVQEGLARTNESTSPWTDTASSTFAAAYDVVYTANSSDPGTIQVKGVSKVEGEVKADVTTAPGWAKSAAHAKTKVSYGGGDVKAEDEEGLAMTTAGTVYEVGVGVTILGNGLNWSGTWQKDEAQAIAIPLLDLDNGDWADDSDVAVTFTAKGYCVLWLGPAKGGSPPVQPSGSVSYKTEVLATVMSRFVPSPLRPH